MTKNIIIGIDLAGSEKNPSGWALWRDKTVLTRHLYLNNEIVTCTVKCHPDLVAIDAPLSLPIRGAIRKVDSEMHKRGYPVFPPLFPAMKKLTLRAVELVREIRQYGFGVIEVHPASTRKALSIPLKEWRKIQTIFTKIGLEGDLKVRELSRHEIDAVTAALTGYLYLLRSTEEIIGDDERERIIVPKRTVWRKLRL